MEDTTRRLMNALRAIRVPAVPGESDIHALTAAALREADIAFLHEETLSPGRRIDFLAGDIGVEIKKGRPDRARLLTQAAGYLSSPRLSALVIVSQKSVRLPHAIAGKPVYLLTLDKLWGVSLP